MLGGLRNTMTMPAEDAYFEIGGDQSRFWSTAQKAYVKPDDLGLAAWLAARSGRVPIVIVSEAELSAMLANIGLGPLAPIPSPAPIDMVAQIKALTDQVNALQTALITAGVVTQASIAASLPTPVAKPLS